MASCFPETRADRPAVRLLLLLALVLALSGGAGTQEPADPFVFTRSLAVELDSPSAGIAASQVDLRIEGRPQPILSVERIESSPIVLFVDLPLLSPASARASLTALAERAPALVERGPVTVVLGGLVSETVVAATRDADELRSALEALLDDLDDQRELGEVFSLRRSLLDDAQGETWETEAVTTISDEEGLLRWQWDALLQALDPSSRDGDGVLFWLQDGLDPDPLIALRRVREPGPGLEARTSRDLSSVLRELGRSLAAEGWWVQTTRLAAAEQEELVPNAAEAAAVLSEPSGGGSIDDPAQLDRVLEALDRRLRVSYRATTIIDDPRPVDLRIDGTAPASWRRWMTTVAPAVRARHLARGRAEGWLEDDERGPQVEAILLPDGSEGATLEARVALRREAGDRQPWTSDRIRVTLLLDSLEAIPLTRQARGGGGPLPVDGTWYLQAALELPPDLDTVSLTVEDLATGYSTTAPVEFDDAPLRRSAEATIERLALGAGPATRTEPSDPALVEIVPPRGEPVTGKVTVRTLVTNDAVRSVRFYLDGELVTTDERPPFRAELDLGDEARPHSVRIVALDLADQPIDDDEVELNAERRSGPVRLTLTPADAGLIVAVELAEDEAEELDRLEIYRNRELLVTLTKPPFRWELDTAGAGPSDFVRALAWLDDGRQLEDVAFLSGLQDRVEVNLVQVFVVVTDRDDRPVTDLGAEDFVLRRGKTDQPIEQFSIAEQVPLLLGLVVDTSLSMMTIMADTQRAAAQFLATTVTPIDRAFVVDFDDRPKLAQGMTGDMLQLMRGLGGLEAGGVTAMYDAILFSLLQFEGERGRRALVLLSDGDDYRSRFGYARVERTVRDAALPVYAIALAGLDPERPSFRKVDLDDLTKASAGRVFYVDSMDDVDSAYDVISAELRNQYVLAFSTDRPLEREELSRIEVETTDRQHRIRFTVGQGLD